METEIGYKEEVFYSKGSEELEQVALRDGGCPIPETFKLRLNWALSS